MPLFHSPSDSVATPVEQRRGLAFLQPLFRLFSGESAREGYLAATDQAIISLTNFLASIYLARFVNPTEFGVFGVGFIVVHLARSIQEGIIVQPLNTFGAPLDRKEFRRYFSTVALLQLLLAGASALAAISLGWALIVTGNDTAGPVTFALWFVFIFWQLGEFLRRALYTRGRVGAAVLNTLIASVARMGYLVWLSGRGALTGIAGLDAMAWGAIAALLVSLWQSRDFWTTHLLNLRQTWLRDWKFGRWVLGGTLANWTSLEVYPILAAGMISFAAAGAYRAIQNLVAPVHALLRATDTFLTPRAARLFDKNGHAGLSRTLRLTYLLTGLPIVGTLALVSLFPQPLLRLLYGETYLPYSQGVAMMAVFYLFWYLYWPLQAAFKATHLTRPIFLANLAAIIAMFTIGIWAIRRWDVYGTIAGQALNAFVVGVVLWVTWWRVCARK